MHFFSLVSLTALTSTRRQRAVIRALIQNHKRYSNLGHTSSSQYYNGYLLK